MASSLRLDGDRTEQFEWRHGHGDEVRELSGSAQPKLSRGSPEFAFVGTGAGGELGEMFDLVVVMGFLRLVRAVCPAVHHQCLGGAFLASGCGCELDGSEGGMIGDGARDS
ncbi:hypothetical protein VFPFJ_09026 [Purpureocillium lilacinum]|uniref:Uncharacterized protein n=1 Tax=Purpureocillium lilacinum TaxID=33203 RepID=A0A179H122_PURLI|nr:hypothetical protein VFPFJ_09026 [Purpureocillium lilacinum]OAQ83223.1 hypothetical protein VFPFJ_09026 [Purpureocillium lilacinum]